MRLLPKWLVVRAHFILNVTSIQLNGKASETCFPLQEHLRKLKLYPKICAWYFRKKILELLWNR